MLQVLKDLASSEKAVVSLAVLIGFTVLTAMGQMAVADYRESALYVLGIYTGGKALQGAASALATKKR